MLLGYVMFTYDNKYSMYGSMQLDDCAKYKDTYTINRINPNFKYTRNKKDISSTYDSFTIVSERFKAFCEQEKYMGLEFVTLPGSPGFYWFKIHNIIEFDAEEYGTRFINYNEQCKGYEEIIGATPARLKNKKPLADGFFRTDLCFGSYQSKSPLKLIGVETRKKLRESGFKNIDFDEIHDKYKWDNK